MIKEKTIFYTQSKILETKFKIEDLHQKLILEQRAANIPKIQEEINFLKGMLHGLSYAKTLINHKEKDLKNSGFFANS
jgi:hypothetical protein